MPRSMHSRATSNGFSSRPEARSRPNRSASPCSITCASSTTSPTSGSRASTTGSRVPTISPGKSACSSRSAPRRSSTGAPERFRPMPELLWDPPSSALAIYAHPDDAEISCGATLARWSNAGCAVHLVICALGDKGSTDPATVPDALVERRREEVAAAARVLGITSVSELGRRDGEIENDLALRRELVALIRRWRPDALVCPDPQAVFFGDH